MGRGRNLIFYFLFSFLQFYLRLLFVVVNSTFMLNSLFICVLFWFSFLYHLSPLSTLEYILVEATCYNPLPPYVLDADLLILIMLTAILNPHLYLFEGSATALLTRHLPSPGSRFKPPARPEVLQNTVQSNMDWSKFNLNQSMAVV
jgi:hypothetical protein